MGLALSVVVAVWEDRAGLARCLAALLAQLDATCELIVVAGVDPAPDDTADSRVRWVRAPAAALIPELWSRGMELAQGNVVAITTSHFEPAPGWAEAVRAASARLDAAGIGGPIDAPRGGTAKDWATYFLRYSNTFHLQHAQTVGDILGDNAAYRASALKKHWSAIAHGFWEPEFHRLVLADSGTLAWVPEMRVTQRASYPFGAFCRQRLLHGREFGSSRVRGRSVGTQILRVLAAPLIPFVFLAKIGARVLKHRRHLGAFVYSLPVLVAFTFVWALGEAWGYLVPIRTHQLTKL